MTRLIVLVLYTGNNMKLLVITGAPGPSLFQSHPAGTVTDNSKFNKQKTKTELFRLLLTVYLTSAFETEKNPRFQTTAQNTFLCQSIKFCLLFSCLNLKL